MFPDLPRSRLFALFGAAALLGLLAGALLSGGEAPPASSGEAPWQLPGEDVLARLDAADVQALKRQAPWRQAADSRAARQQARRVAWRLAGVVSDGGGTALVVSGKELSRVQPGQDLPDGARLLEVRSDRIVISDQGCRRTLMLFADPKAAPAPECDTSGENAD